MNPNTQTTSWRKYIGESSRSLFELHTDMRSYLALVNTFCNAASELVSERLVPEPHIWNDDDVPPMPTDPPPEGYVPIDDGTPKYKAYVPKFADPRFPYIRAEDRGRV